MIKDNIVKNYKCQYFYVHLFYVHIQLSKADWGFECKILLDINTVPCSVVWEDIRYIITITKLWYIQANLMCESNAIQMIKGKLCNLKKNHLIWSHELPSFIGFGSFCLSVSGKMTRDVMYTEFVVWFEIIMFSFSHIS